jgi:hypothetical protein
MLFRLPSAENEGGGLLGVCLDQRLTSAKIRQRLLRVALSPVFVCSRHNVTFTIVGLLTAG